MVYQRIFVCVVVMIVAAFATSMIDNFFGVSFKNLGKAIEITHKLIYIVFGAAFMAMIRWIGQTS